MAQTSAMEIGTALDGLHGDFAVIQKLDNEPNDVGGLSADELKAKFDQAPLAIQKYINDVLVRYVNGAVVPAHNALNREVAAVRDDLAQAIIAAGALPLGGGIGQVLLKTGTGNYETAWGDDPTAYVNAYNEHWWAIQHGVGGSGYREVKTPLTNNYTLFETESIYGTGGTLIKQYASEVEFDANGKPSLKNPTSWTRSAPRSYSECEDYAKAILALAPCYIGVEDFPNTDILIFYIPENATCTYNGNGTIWWNSYPLDNDMDGYEETEGYVVSLHRANDTAVPAQLVTGEYYEIPPGEITYEHSADRNAYPDSGSAGDTAYEYLGIPFEKLPRSARFTVGSYVGTGTYGAANPCSLTFDFTPKILIFFKTAADAYLKYSTPSDAVLVWGVTTRLYTASSSPNTLSYEGNTVNWYSAGSADYQLNVLGTAYYYVAMG